MAKNNFIDVSEVLKDIQSLQRSVLKAQSDIIDNFCDDFEEHVLRDKSFNGNKIRELKIIKNESSCQIIADKNYASFLNDGTPPHKILPKNKKRLFFFWPKIEDFIFLKLANHPGTKPTKFFDNATDYASKKMEANIDKIYSKMIERFNK